MLSISAPATDTTPGSHHVHCFRHRSDRPSLGPALGYFVGFVAAAAIVGHLAERRQDRTLSTSVAAMTLGSLVIYIFGAGWLAHDLNLPVANGDTNALSLGVTPFLIGDVIKLALAGALLPAAWALVDRRR